MLCTPSVAINNVIVCKDIKVVLGGEGGLVVVARALRSGVWGMRAARRKSGARRAVRESR